MVCSYIISSQPKNQEKRKRKLKKIYIRTKMALLSLRIPFIICLLNTFTSTYSKKENISIRCEVFENRLLSEEALFELGALSTPEAMRSEWVCMPEPSDDHAWGVTYEFFDLPPGFMNEHGILSGQHIVEISSVNVIEHHGQDGDEGFLSINPGAQLMVTEKNKRRKKQNLRSKLSVYDNEEEDEHRKLTSGTKSILVIRGVGLDVEITRSPSVIELGNEVFGTIGYTAKTRFQDCSNGLFQITPAVGNENVTNGVVEVQVDFNLSGMERQVVQNHVLTKAREYVGDLEQYDHVMISLPKEVDFHGISAFGQLNGKLSIYKNKFIMWHSIQMHELGHNLGLHHSGVDPINTYSDHTCLMGNPGAEVTTCFNGPKSWFLNWYERRHKTVSLERLIQGPWSGNLVGIDDYVNGLTIEEKHYVIVKIKATTQAADDIYLMFNRKKGVNGGVIDFPDLVTVYQGANENGISHLSYILAGLNVDDEYRIPNFSGQRFDLMINVPRMVFKSPDRAKVHIYLEECITDSDCHNIFDDCNVVTCNSERKCVKDCAAIDDIEIIVESFENGFGYFNDGGKDAIRKSNYAHTGIYSVQIRDNTKTSIVYSNSIDVAVYTTVRINFWYMSIGMENGEDFFLEYSSDDGTTWATARSWVRGVNFWNKANLWRESTVEVDVSSTNNMIVRFRCDASADNDKIYIDDVRISGL